MAQLKINELLSPVSRNPIAILNNEVLGITPLNIRGQTFNLSFTNLEEIIHGAPSIEFRTVDTTFAIASTSVLDTSGGTGARTVLVEGYDEKGLDVSETITMNGQSKVTFATQFMSFSGMEVFTVGSTGKNQGRIHIGLDSDSFTNGIPDNDLFYVMEASNRSCVSSFKVPANRNLILGDGFYYTNSEFLSDSIFMRIGVNKLSIGSTVRAELCGFILSNNFGEFKLPTLTFGPLDIITFEARSQGSVELNLSIFFNSFLVEI